MKTKYDFITKELSVRTKERYKANKMLYSKIKISRKSLFNKYVTKKMTMLQIAEELDCCAAYVFKLLKKYNITTRKRGEHTRWNKNLTKDIDERVAKYAEKEQKTMKKRYASGEIVPWNYGLTKETDERVRKAAEDFSKNHFDCAGDKNGFHGKHHSDEFKREQSIRKGGTGIPYENAEYDPEFNDILKEEIRERDNRVCQVCGMTQEESLMLFNRALHVHHIDFNKKNCDPNNLISLCIKCHFETNTNRSFWKQYFKGLMLIK